MANETNTNTQNIVITPELQALISQITAQAVATALATKPEAGKGKTKKDEKADAVDVVDEITYRTQEFHKELKAAGMVNGKDYWVHTNEKGKTKLFACVHHTQPEWSRKLEALGFIPTRA